MTHASVGDGPTVVVVGAGAIGGTVGGWLAEHHRVHFVDQGETAARIKARGLTLYRGGRRDRAETRRVPIADDVRDAPPPDLIVVAVKNYDLDHVLQRIRPFVSGEPVVVALQNGVENQTVVPRYFARPVFGVVGYNAWVDEPGVIGYRERGPVVLGTIGGDAPTEVGLAAGIFGRGLRTLVSHRLQDAAYTKMVVNLANALTTLVGFGDRDVPDMDLFQLLMTRTTYEGVQIVRAAGHREFRLPGMPSWRNMALAARLPPRLVRPFFRRYLGKLTISSMTQDVLRRGSPRSELETLNGHLLQVADRWGVDAPYNRTIYELCRASFGPGFEPLEVREVWRRVQERHRDLHQRTSIDA